MHAIAHVRQANDVLTSRDGDARARLAVAAHDFWAAFEAPESWPGKFQPRAYRITGRLFSRAMIDRSVFRMEDAEVEETIRLLGAYCDDALRQAAVPDCSFSPLAHFP